MRLGGWVRAEWGVSENNRRARSYTSDAGRSIELQVRVFLCKRHEALALLPSTTGDNPTNVSV